VSSARLMSVRCFQARPDCRRRRGQQPSSSTSARWSRRRPCSLAAACVCARVAGPVATSTKSSWGCHGRRRLQGPCLEAAAPTQRPQTLRGASTRAGREGCGRRRAESRAESRALRAGLRAGLAQQDCNWLKNRVDSRRHPYERGISA
jgi:hypothetical protein